MEIRRSYDRLISTMGFPILVRWHLYIESGPRFFLYGQYRGCWWLGDSMSQGFGRHGIDIGIGLNNSLCQIVPGNKKCVRPTRFFSSQVARCSTWKLPKISVFSLFPDWCMTEATYVMFRGGHHDFSGQVACRATMFEKVLLRPVNYSGMLHSEGQIHVFIICLT